METRAMEGKACLVTGGGGIGLGAAKELAAWVRLFWSPTVTRPRPPPPWPVSLRIPATTR